MRTSRRTFLGGVSAFAAFARALAAAAPDAHTFEPGGGRAADFLICRRLYLDICGRLPRPEEVDEFTATRDAKKVESLVDRLLDSDGYADYWSMRLCDILRVKSEFPINLWPNAVYVYHRRIRAAVVGDEPWDAFARALLAGRGSNFRVPESNFLRAAARRTPEGLSEAISRTFLLEATEDHARYFSRVAWKSTREWKEEIVYLKQGPADAVPEAFMEVLEGPRRAEFHAAPVKRVHWWLFDSLPKSDRLREWTRVFERGGLRLKPLLRHVFTSREYLAGPIRGGFPARRLDAEVLDDAICDLTGATRSFQSIAPEPFSYLPPTRRTILVEDGSISSAFLLLFGRPARDTGALEERNNEITAKQRLYLFNSGELWNRLGALVADRTFAKLSRTAQIDNLFRRFLSRPPVKQEIFLLDRRNPLPIREIAWHLVNSQEFLYRI